jgi:hypothetical protein
MLWEMYPKSRSKMIQKTSNPVKRRSLLLRIQFKNIAVPLRSISTAVYTLKGQLAKHLDYTHLSNTDGCTGCDPNRKQSKFE